MTSGRSDTRVEQHGSVTTVTVSGEADLQNLAEVVEAFARALRDPHTKSTVIDLSALTFADSVLLNQLLTAQADHRAAGRPLRVAGPLHSGVERLLEITGTDEILDIAPDLAAALDELDSGPR
ncbi:STAS domain-containing protein [Streptomyces sp. NPDC052225]|uniref:STAS domain-containing protein n=1 Tax=Streptomyces sp. NPDC052225 TaxID=3154949 RepID=UPI003440ED72